MALEMKLRSFERERFRSFWALKKERAVALTAAFQSASLSAGVPGLLHLSLTARAKPGVKAIQLGTSGVLPLLPGLAVNSTPTGM